MTETLSSQQVDRDLENIEEVVELVQDREVLTSEDLDAFEELLEETTEKLVIPDID